MASAALLSLTLTDFRSYERARLETEGRSVYLFGANGAGKTNLLEAISLLTPGKGLRGASMAEVGRLADHVRPIWLTPAQDRLFLEAASERRRFFDRLVFAGEPAHAANANAY